MRRMILAVALISLAVLPACAQSRSNRLSLSAGYAPVRGLSATFAYEREVRYHRSFEILADAYLKWEDCPSCGHVCPDSFWNSYNTFLFGGTWKPCVLRRRNSWGNLRLGADFGTDKSEFVAGILLGYERNYALNNGWLFFWQARTDIMINARDVFRPGISIGIKFPIYKNAI